MIITPGSDWAIGQVHHGDESDLSLWTLPVRELGSPTARWRPVCGRADLVTEFAVRGDDIFLLTARDAPRFRVVRTSLAAPSVAAAEVVVPAGEAVVHDVATAADALYVGVSRGVRRDVLRLPYDRPNDAREIPTPASCRSTGSTLRRAS